MPDEGLKARLIFMHAAFATTDIYLSRCWSVHTFEENGIARLTLTWYHRYSSYCRRTPLVSPKQIRFQVVVLRLQNTW